MSYIEIDNARCKSCYLCVEACPLKLIKKSNEIGNSGLQTVEFDNKEDKCTACAICAHVCPDIAITGVYKD